MVLEGKGLAKELGQGIGIYDDDVLLPKNEFNDNCIERSEYSHNPWIYGVWCLSSNRG